MIRFTFFFLIIFCTHHTVAQAPAKMIMGRTTGVLPYLEYGLGADRLGGAKMTFLDTGVVMHIADSTVVNYKVQLSANHYAYINKSNIKKDSTLKLPSYYLTNSWLVYG